MSPSRPRGISQEVEVQDSLASLTFSVHSSPSSQDNYSNDDTPGTKLTDFSPECSRDDKTTIVSAAGEVVHPPSFTLPDIATADSPKGQQGIPLTSGVHDPFTVGPRPLKGQGSHVSARLSPTAATFMPLRATPARFRKGSLSSIWLQPTSPSTAVSYLNATSVPDIDIDKPRLNPIQALHTTNTSSVLSPIGSPGHINAPGSASGGDCLLTGMEFSNAGSTTRYLKISQVMKTATIEELNIAFNEPTFAVPKLVVVTDLTHDGVVYAEFADIRDSRSALPRLSKTQPGWLIEFISNKDFMHHCGPSGSTQTSEFEGQIVVTARCSGPKQGLNVQSLTSIVKSHLETFGEIMAWAVITISFPTIVIRVEFFDCTVIDKLLKLSDMQVAGINMSIVRYAPDIMKSAGIINDHQGPIIVGQDGEESESLLQRPVTKRSSNSSFVTESGPDSYSLLFAPGSNQPSPVGTRYFQPLSPSGSTTSGYTYSPDSGSLHGYQFLGVPRSALPAASWTPLGCGGLPNDHAIASRESLCSAFLTPTYRTPSKLTGRRDMDYLSGHHNVVDVERIRQGLDVRTTIMLRNIPNKIDQAMLKEIIDETSHSRYDFMYLRIDFANNCNVGYAFINFEDPWFIIDFVKARAGRRWNRFNSDKVAEVSYATIQGKDCLVQKFRNSSVMLEHASFRPKIFHTGAGPMAGNEDSFPGPDNPSKMRRSVENAEHVGLFAPRVGQHFRDEQRRRRSQYDRGTRLAEIEDTYGPEGYDRYGYINQSRRGLTYNTCCPAPGISFRGN